MDIVEEVPYRVMTSVRQKVNGTYLIPRGEYHQDWKGPMASNLTSEVHLIIRTSNKHIPAQEIFSWSGSPRKGLLYRITVTPILNNIHLPQTEDILEHHSIKVFVDGVLKLEK